MPDATRDAVLVTGAGRRVGAVIARALAAAGWFVHLHANSSVADAEGVLADLRRAGGDGAVVTADLADPAAVADLVPACAGNGPAPVALINNAAVFEYDFADTVSAAALDRHFAVNTRAPALLSKALADHLPPGRDGAIVNILDNKLFAPNADYFSYTLSKFALHGATLAMAMAFAPRLRVNGIAPGIMLVSGHQTEAGFRAIHKRNPLGRGATPDDIARAARYLLEVPGVNGQVVVIDGGQVLERQDRDTAFQL